MSDVSVSQSGPQGMITLRGDLDHMTLQAACKALTGADMPAMGKITMNDANAIGWMSPDEVLLLLPYAEANGGVQTLREKLAGQHHLAANVSDARAMFTVSGTAVRDSVAKLTPVDMHPDSLAIGDLRRTQLGQVAAAFWMTDAAKCQVVCFRSVADYMANLLATSAAAGAVNFLSNG